MAELRVKGTGTLKLFENDNTSSVTIASPASLGGDRTVTLPDASVTLASGTMLATDGDGSSLTGLPDNTPIFLVTLGSQQGSISRSTQTKITYASEVIDSDNAFDSTTNYRFTVPSGKGGKYMFIVSASAEMPSYDPQAIMTSLYVNGSQVAFHQYFANEADFQNDQPNQVPLVTIQDLSASDYVEGFINFYQGSGGTGQIEDDNGTFFQGFRITS